MTRGLTVTVATGKTPPVRSEQGGGISPPRRRRGDGLAIAPSLSRRPMTRRGRSGTKGGAEGQWRGVTGRRCGWYGGGGCGSQGWAIWTFILCQINDLDFQWKSSVAIFYLGRLAFNYRGEILNFTVFILTYISMI